MKIFKNFSNRHTQVKIAQNIPEPELSLLNESKGVIDNFLKYKRNLGEVSIIKGDLFGNKDCISIVHSKSKGFNRVSILRKSDAPFLRRIYAAIEEVVK